jgi:G3E family GTPase
MNINLKTLLLPALMALALGNAAYAEPVDMHDAAVGAVKDKAAEVSGKSDTMQQAPSEKQAAHKTAKHSKHHHHHAKKHSKHHHVKKHSKHHAKKIKHVVKHKKAVHKAVAKPAAKPAK